MIKLITVFHCILLLTIVGCKGDKSNGLQKESDVVSAVEKDESTKTMDKPTILFFGNSLTAGYGLDPSESFPSNIENIIDSLNLSYNVVNAGLSGETTSGGLNRIDWVLNQQVDVFVLELGANDMLRGLPVEETETNLIKILDRVEAKYPEAKLAICQMMAPPNMGPEYAKVFNNLYQKIANDKGIGYIPFFLDGVAGDTDLMLQDGKHPNAAGQKIVAANVWEYLSKML